MKSNKLLFTLGLLVSASAACLASSSSSAIDTEKEAKRQATFLQNYQLRKESFLRREQNGNAVDLSLCAVSFTSFIQKSEKEGARFDEADLREFFTQHDVGNKFRTFLGERLFKRDDIQGGIEILKELPHGQLLIAHAYEDIHKCPKADEIYHSLIRSFQESDPIAGEMHPRLHYADFLWRNHNASEAESQYAILMENPLYITYASIHRFNMHVFFKEQWQALVDFHTFLSVLETVTADNMTLLCRLFEHTPNNEGWTESLYEMLKKPKVPFKAVELFESKVGPLKHTLCFTGFAEGIKTRKAAPFSHKIQCTTPRYHPVNLGQIGWKTIYKY